MRENSRNQSFDGILSRSGLDATAMFDNLPGNPMEYASSEAMARGGRDAELEEEDDDAAALEEDDELDEEEDVEEEAGV